MNNTPQYLYDASTFDKRFAGNMWDQLNAISHSIPDVVPEPAKSAWDQVIPYVDWLKTETGLIATGAFVAVWVAVFFGLRYLRAKSTSRGGEMGHWQRQQDLKKIISDILCDTVEDARYKDLITRAEKFTLYKQMAKFFELPDLIVQRHPSRKKAEIRQRIGNGVYKTKPDIPGDAPTASVPVVKPPARNRMVLKKTVRVQPVKA